MANFDKAVDVVFKNEGGFVDDAADKGGATKFGISLAFLQKHGIDINHDGKTTKDDIIILTLADAKALYKENFWKPIMGDKITSQRVATKLLDMVVLSGTAQGVRDFQRGVISCGGKIVEDAICGSKTVEAANLISADLSGETMLIERVREFQRVLYAHIVRHDRTQGKFWDGWMKRVESC
jgi:lysozyme family protein